MKIPTLTRAQRARILGDPAPRVSPAAWVAQHTRTMWKLKGAITNKRRQNADYFAALVEAPSLRAALDKVAVTFPAGAEVYSAEPAPAAVVILASASPCASARENRN
jgi:hypothetical protein